MEITWLGHAAFRLKGGGKTLYIDPVEMAYCGVRTKHVFEGLEPADIILLTHDHTDHCNPGSLQPLRTPSTITVGPESCREKLGTLVHVLNPGDSTSVGTVAIRAVYAYNIKRERAPGSPFHPRGSGVGYLLTIDGRTVYHAGDTEPVPEMDGLGPVDVALLPVDGHYTMSPEEAMQCAATVKATTVVPMHFFETPLERVLAAATAYPGINVQALDIGEIWDMQ